MNKRKILMVALSIMMVAILAVGGTMAYFTDSDYNMNVMVTGNVQIDQIEQQRADGNKDADGRNEGELVDYVDGGKLFPVTHDTMSGYQSSIISGNDIPNSNAAGNAEGGFKVSVFNTKHNYIDKIVTVKNTGESDAYVRTVFAFEVGTDGNSLIGHNGKNVICYCYGTNGGITFTGEQFTKDGITYEVAYAYYDTLAGEGESMLIPGEVSCPSLTQVFMNKDVTNTEAARLGTDRQFNILVVSQGTQTVGFTSAEEALNAAFGEINATNAADWFANTESKGISVEK